MLTLDERSLLDAARTGDAGAFGVLAAQSAPRLLRLARALLGDAHAAEDAVQEGLLRAWRGIGRHRGDAAFATWLHAIVTRECLRAMAKRRRSHRVHELTDVELERAERADPARIAEQVADRDALLGALALLPPAQRAAVVLHDVEELTAGEIADLTGVPLGTAKSRIREGRLALLVHLTEEDPR